MSHLWKSWTGAVIRLFKFLCLPRVLLSISILLLAILLLEAFQFSSRYIQHREDSQTFARQSSLVIAEDLAKDLESISNIAKEIKTASEDYVQNNGDCTRGANCDFESALQKIYLNHAKFETIGVAFCSYAYRQSYKLYSPFIRKPSLSKGTVERIDNYYDYQLNAQGCEGQSTKDNNDLSNPPPDWFQQGLNGQADWQNPSIDLAFNDYVIRYTSAASMPNHKPFAVAFADINLTWLRQKLEKHNIGDNNYLFIINQSNQKLYHSLLGNEAIRTNIGEPLLSGFSNFNHAISGSTITSELTNKQAWLHKIEIKGTNWQLVTVISTDTHAYDDELTNSKASIQAEHNGTKLHNTTPRNDSLTSKTERVYWVTLVVFLAFFMLSYFRQKHYRIRAKTLAKYSIAFTTIFVMGTCGLWVWERHSVDVPDNSKQIMSNPAAVEKFKKRYAIESLNTNKVAPQFVPVGLFIQSIEFISATNVSLTGYIWHRYKEEQNFTLKEGTIFPEAITTSIKEAYERTTNGEIVKGWYFETTLRERFDPSQFPFDKQSVWVRMWHEQFGQNIILVPDFKSYNSLNTKSLPGVEKDFVLSGWRLFRSFFDMRENTYNTNFGSADYTGSDKMPELYFNIELQRRFINPFIAHLFPLLVVLLMLFAILVTTSRREHSKDIFGFNVSTVVASCSALFFVVLIAHVQLRGELSANSIVYLEYFYLFSYGLILLITINSVIFSWQLPVKFIQFHDNLWPKLLYWPFLSAGLFFCTLWLFLKPAFTS